MSSSGSGCLRRKMEKNRKNAKEARVRKMQHAKVRIQNKLRQRRDACQRKSILRRRKMAAPSVGNAKRLQVPKSAAAVVASDSVEQSVCFSVCVLYCYHQHHNLHPPKVTLTKC